MCSVQMCVCVGGAVWASSDVSFYVYMAVTSLL